MSGSEEDFNDALERCSVPFDQAFSNPATLTPESLINIILASSPSPPESMVPVALASSALDAVKKRPMAATQVLSTLKTVLDDARVQSIKVDDDGDIEAFTDIFVRQASDIVKDHLRLAYSDDEDTSIGATCMVEPSNPLLLAILFQCVAHTLGVPTGRSHHVDLVMDELSFYGVLSRKEQEVRLVAVCLIFSILGAKQMMDEVVANAVAQPAHETFTYEDGVGMLKVRTEKVKHAGGAALFEAIVKRTEENSEAKGSAQDVWIELFGGN